VKLPAKQRQSRFFPQSQFFPLLGSDESSWDCLDEEKAANRGTATAIKDWNPCPQRVGDVLLNPLLSQSSALNLTASR
jgi:hypothetical protein